MSLVSIVVNISSMGVVTALHPCYRQSVTCIFVAMAALAAVNLSLSDRDITRAVEIGISSEQARARFHASYIIPINDPTVERLEVITPFRRLVFITEERQRLGDWLFSHSGVRDPKAALQPWRGRLSLLAGLRFHPQNTFGDIPPYEIVVGGPGGPLRPLDVIRTALTAPVSGRPGEFFTTLIGATIESVFDLAVVGEATRSVTVVLEGKPVAGATIDFARLD